jgi:hypothetical protein
MEKKMPGPVPKRPEERVRRNDDVIPTDKVEVFGDVVVPPLNMPFEPHPLVIDFYDGLINSAQAALYEPSDWEYARIVCFMLQTLVTSSKPSSEMYKAWQTATSNLLVTEGDRRRLRIEIARAPQQNAAKDEDAQIIEMFMERMEKAEASRAQA